MGHLEIGKATNDEIRLEQAYLRYADNAYRLAYVLTGNQDSAEELVQEGFTRIWSRFADLRGDDWFQAYLRRTIINLAKSRRRNAWRRSQISQRRLARPEVSVQFPDIESAQCLWDMIARLPTRQKAAMYFRYYEDLPETQIASALNSTPGAVKSLIHRALKTLRSEMEWSDQREGDSYERV